MAFEDQDITVSRKGASLGAKTALLLTSAYVVILLVITVIAGVISAFVNDVPFLTKHLAYDTLALTALYILYGALFGLPAVMLGLLTGWIMGRILQNRKQRMSATKFSFIGLCVSLILILPANLFVLKRITIDADPFFTFDLIMYLIILGIPSLIYTIAEFFVSRRLFYSTLNSS